jgi:single-strand DNA-binding protein
MNFNKVILIGRLTRDPENRALPSGQSLTSFGMATDRFFTDKNGQKQQQVEFHNIVLFGKLADIAVQYLNKGSLVLIEGRLQTRTWQDSSGNKRTRTEIVAERLQLGPKSAGKITPAAPPQEGTEETKKEEIPIIEEDEIDIKDIPF